MVYYNIGDIDKNIFLIEYFSPNISTAQLNQQ